MEKGSSSSASGGGGRAADHSHSHSLNGLNFGKKIYFQGGGGVGSGVLRPRSSGGGRLPEEEAALPRSPAKKGRSSVEGGQPPRCQVEGCNIDLSGTKAYYCRHKVCGIHSKSSRVIVSGLHQRFCQQCSRFHQLPEFDQGKRSCRRRLAGHNERRRKPPPPPGPFMSASYTTTLSPPTFDNQSKTGGLVMDFTRREDSWPNNNHNNIISALKYEQDDEDDDDDDLLEDSTNTRNNTRHSYCGGAVITSPCPESSSTNKSALSLLSKQPIPTWESTNQSLLLQPSLDTTTAAAAQFSWGLKAANHHHHQAAANSTAAATTFHEMAPPHHMQAQYSRHELGLSQLSEGHYHGLEGPTGYDAASLQHMNWSL